MDRVDIVIVILLFFAIIRGANLGFFRLVFSVMGFIVGLLLGSYASLEFFKYVNLSNAASKLLAILVVEAIFAIVLSVVFEETAIYITRRAQGVRLPRVDQILGGIFEAVTILFLVWLIAPSLYNVQAARVGYFVSNSTIVDNLNSLLPTPPNFLARLQAIVSPNTSPSVFSGLEPQHTTIKPNSQVDNAIITNDEQSVVKIEGNGCGGLVEGSGFVVSSGIVVTNAHVVAGIKQPEILDGSGSFKASVIWFDPNVDLAVLSARDVLEPALQLSTAHLSQGTGVVVLGYPNNGQLISQAGIIDDQIIAQGQNIYNQGTIDRNIYEVQADIQAGNSGGPLIISNGQVAGIVFAKSTDQDNLGYALLSSDVQASIQKAITRNEVVGDGTCAD
jgi:S1-C subfamily serine protease